MALYTDSILDKLILALNTSGPTKLRNKYFVGDPVIVNHKSLPMCFVSRDSTAVAIGTNTQDRHEMVVVLNLVYSGAADLNQKSFTQAGALALYELVEGRDTTYDINTDTILGVLRANQVLDGPNNLYIDVEGNNTSVEYVLSPPERRGIFSVEAIIRTTLRNYQVRP